jgi:hypothetical protein
LESELLPAIEETVNNKETTIKENNFFISAFFLLLKIRNTII